MTVDRLDRSATPAAILGLLALGNFVVGMGAFVVIGILGPIAEGLNVPLADAGIVLTVYALAYMLASPVAAAVTGQVARRTVLILTMALFLGGSLLSALAADIGLLTAARIVAAVGAAIYTPVAAGVAVAISSPDRRGQALSLVFGGLTLAQVAGVPAGAWLAYRFGWQAAFWSVSVLAALGLAAIAALMPRQVAFQPATVRSVLRTLGDWRVSFAVAFTATFIGAIYVVFTFFGPLVEATTGSSAALRSLLLALFGIGAVVGNFAGGWATDRFGGRPTLIVLCVAQALIMPLFSISPWSLLGFALLVTVWSTFGWSFMSPQQARLVGLAPQSQALVLALNAAAIYLGIALGSAVSGAVLAGYGLGALGIAGGACALLALLHLLASDRLARR